MKKNKERDKAKALVLDHFLYSHFPMDEDLPLPLPSASNPSHSVCLWLPSRISRFPSSFSSFFLKPILVSKFPLECFIMIEKINVSQQHFLLIITIKVPHLLFFLSYSWSFQKNSRFYDNYKNTQYTYTKTRTHFNEKHRFTKWEALD